MNDTSNFEKQNISVIDDVVKVATGDIDKEDIIEGIELLAKDIIEDLF